MALLVVVAALGVGVKGQLALQQIGHFAVRIAGDAGVELDTRLGQRGAGTAADTAADQSVHTVPLEEARQSAVAAAHGADHLGGDHLAVLDLIELKLFTVAEVLEHLAVFVGYCEFHHQHLTGIVPHFSKNARGRRDDKFLAQGHGFCGIIGSATKERTRLACREARKGNSMNEKEVAELRRRFRQDRSGISHVRGCYVNQNGEIISQFDQSLGVMTQEENDKILGLLKKTLSGTLGKNLLDITFETQQVVSGAEHKLLMTLRNSQLQDEEAVQEFFQKVIGGVELETNYLVLLVHDAYDVPYKAKDGEELEDSSSEVYSYILCSICPIKETKPALSYSVQENQFHNLSPDWVVAQPEMGFLFPAFDDRSTNLYNALYYSKDVQDVHEALIDALFHTPAPMPAEIQKATFASVLSDTLGEECSHEVVQAVHDQLCGLMEDHKESHEPEPLVVGKREVRQALSANGVSQEHMDAFEGKYDEAFGADAQLSPRNLVDPKRVELKTADVTIKVNPDRSDLVQTRVINGVKYILVRVEEGVELNGVPVQIEE